MSFLDRPVFRAITLVVSAILGITAALIVSNVQHDQVSAAAFNVSIQGFAFNKQTLDISVGDTVQWTNRDSSAHTATSDSGLWNSGSLSNAESFSFTFTSPGSFPYFCGIHPFMTGTIVVSQPQGSPSPALTGPANGAVLGDFNPTLTWSLPDGSTQYHLKVTPANDDGPGVSVIGNAATSFTIPPPPQWYGLLPDLGYTWMVRATNLQAALGENDNGWGEWSAPFTFRTPVVTSAGIGHVAPPNGGTVNSLTPTVQWSNSNSNIFYYEVQISKDPAFGPNAFLYSELRHGGVTSPPNSYTVPSDFPLEPNTRYFWRVRPRVQGDGTPVQWSTGSEFISSSG